MKKEGKQEEADSKKIINAMIEGYGPNFPALEALFESKISHSAREELMAIIPGLGRYYKNTKALEDVTSGKAVGLRRFKVGIEYFIQLSVWLSNYVHSQRRIVGKLTPEDIRKLRKIGTTLKEIKQAEIIEKFTDHDTAAAMDYLKLKIAAEFPYLAQYVEAVHFALTSENNVGIVFGTVGNELVYGHFMKALLDLCEFMINYVDINESEGPLILPALTHRQAAEPTTLGKKIATRLYAIDSLIRRLVTGVGQFQPFSGTLNGAVGNFSCHYVAYPEGIRWEVFAKEFVEKQGLQYEIMSDQCVTYAVESHIFTTIANILTQVIKLVDDFVDLAACPGQFFVKRKKAGQKGSSIMPNKSNAWAREGAIGMLEEARSHLIFLACSLPAYPHEGDMKRSYLFRNIATAFMPILIAFKRITSEMANYYPNHKKIQNFFNEYPGMAGSSIQTVMKRMGIKGDAYRSIQDISINHDGSYANASQFRRGLGGKMKELDLTRTQRRELRSLTNMENLVRPIHEITKDWLKRERAFVKIYRSWARNAYEPIVKAKNKL